jgi:hypothetical protein
LFILPLLIKLIKLQIHPPPLLNNSHLFRTNTRQINLLVRRFRNAILQPSVYPRELEDDFFEGAVGGGCGVDEAGFGRVTGELAFCVDDFCFEGEVFVEEAADVCFEGFDA